MNCSNGQHNKHLSKYLLKKKKKPVMQLREMERKVKGEIHKKRSESDITVVWDQYE